MAHTLDGQGDRQAAVHYYQQSVELFREIGDQWGLTHPLCDLALHIWDEGRLGEAFALIQEYLAVFRRFRSAASIPMALSYLTNMAITLGDFATAAAAAQEKGATELARGLPLDKASGLFSLASVNFAQGNLIQARHQLESAHEAACLANAHSFTSDIVFLLARLTICEGAPDQAAILFAESKRLARQGEPRPWLDAQIALGLGQVACLKRDFVGAAQLFRQSLEQIQVIRPETPSRLEGLAQACLGLDQAAPAATLLGAAHHLREMMGAPILPVDLLRYTATLSAVRSALHDEDFRQAWDAGEALSMEQAVAYALHTPCAPVGSQ